MCVKCFTYHINCAISKGSVQRNSQTDSYALLQAYPQRSNSNLCSMKILTPPFLTFWNEFLVTITQQFFNKQKLSNTQLVGLHLTQCQYFFSLIQMGLFTQILTRSEENKIYMKIASSKRPFPLSNGMESYALWNDRLLELNKLETFEDAL